MPVTPFEPSMAQEVTDLYNRQVLGLPHCFSASHEQLSLALSGNGECGHCEHLRSPQGFVIRESGRIVGFAHTAVEVPREAEQVERGIVRFLLYERGHRAAGQELLLAAEGALREQGVGMLMAFHQDYRLPFYHIGHAYLSDRLEHVHALFGMNGYTRCAGEVYLDWPNHEPVKPKREPGVELTVTWEPGLGRRPNLTIRATVDGRPVGVCENRCCGEYSQASEASDWMLTKWLGVNQEHQGKRLGMLLLQAALFTMHDEGYRHAVISTSWTNHRACLFYSNCGYRCVDWTYAVSKEL